MKNFIFLFFILFLFSCGDGRTDRQREYLEEMRRRQAEKKSNEELAVEEKRDSVEVKNITPPRGEGSIVITKEEDGQTVYREKSAAKRKIDSLEEVIMNLKQEKLTSSGALSLPRSTYKVTNEKQVKALLMILLNKSLKQLNKAAKVPGSNAEDMLHMAYNIEYCDDQVLEYLDKLCDQINKEAASNVLIDNTYLYKEDIKRIKKITYKSR